MFKRKIYSQLFNWKESERRKPLVLRGARQVGKSTLVRMFSQEYKNYIELNLERDDDRKLFENLSVKEIYNILLLRNNLSEKDELLLFIDEIQEEPRAIQLIRFFYEDLPNLHLIAAGSLLEHALKDVQSFPVGRVQQLVLHPFDFEEYLMAIGADLILEKVKSVPLENYLHTSILEIFHQYLAVGGMPEAIQHYKDSASLPQVQNVLEEIWESYADDASKYAENNSERRVLRHVIETAAFEKDRITLANFGNSAYKSREVGEALRSLDKARFIQTIYPCTSTEVPLTVDIKRKPRLQFLDTGLLIYKLNAYPEMIGLEDMSALFRGRIIQHMVHQQVQAQNNKVNNKYHFWVREKANSNSEVDLVYQHKSLIIPVEVKAGKSGRLRSLHQFMDSCQHHYAVRFLANEFSVEKVKTIKGKYFYLMNLPYYLSGELKAYLDWFTNKKDYLTIDS